MCGVPVLNLSRCLFSAKLRFFRYKWPRFWLISHFWTPEQRIEFGTLDIKDRISHNRDIFRALQAKLPQVESRDYYDNWNNILAKLGSGQHPTADEIIAIKELFTEAPYTHRSLSRSHLVSCNYIDCTGFITILYNWRTFFLFIAETFKRFT